MFNGLGLRLKTKKREQKHPSAGDMSKISEMQKACFLQWHLHSTAGLAHSVAPRRWNHATQTDTKQRQISQASRKKNNTGAF